MPGRLSARLAFWNGRSSSPVVQRESDALREGGVGAEPELQNGGRVGVGVIDLREADEQASQGVAIAGQTQGECVGAVLQGTGERIAERVLHEQEESNGEQDHRQRGNIADAVQPPTIAPAPYLPGQKARSQPEKDSGP